ncbi:COG4223 family protein [Hyphococcus sp.]|uniref:COG4223 family protein n=1 Tax=Hyphococcus sp. TaxID=2038636 RepID=UPI0020846015|nr:MAG: hypothetical protein DHS20C04_23500 [Marinicaulis sp.]
MAEHGDNPDKRDTDPRNPDSGDGESLPEVEAELVSETAPSADAFEDDAQEDQAQADADAGGAPEAPIISKRPSTLTPGVMLFLGFAVLALGAFAIWRLQGQREPVAESPAQEVAGPIEAAPVAGEAVAGETGTTVAPAPRSPIEPQEKTENTSSDVMKRAPEPVTDEEAGYLPPVTEGAASKLTNSVEEGAKEAIRRFREAEEGGEQQSPVDPSTDQVTGFEVTPGAAAPDGANPSSAPIGELAATEQENIPEEQPSTAAAGVDAASAAASFEAERSTLIQEFTAEKQQLEASLVSERQRADNEAEESARLRAALDEAIQRDQTAQEELATLRASLDQLRNETSSTTTRQLKASFALAALSRAISQGDPYMEELAAVEQFEPAAAALEAHAEKGVASESAIRSRFDAAARAALAAAAQAKAGGGFAGLMARAQSVISVRPAEPTSGDEPGAVLSRADHALEQGEVAFALLQLEDLPLAAQEAMSDWIADARARAEAESALAALSARIAGDAD